MLFSPEPGSFRARRVRRSARRLAALAAAALCASAAAREFTLQPGDPLPPLQPGDTLTLVPGVHVGPWTLAVADITIDALGAVLVGDGDGNVLTLEAPGIAVNGLELAGSGTTADLYFPDAAVALNGCHGCSLVDIRSHSAPTAVRVDSSERVSVSGSDFKGDGASPGITSYLASWLTLADNSFDTFLDGFYLERSDMAAVIGNTFVGTTRYALHVMYSAGTVLHSNLVRGSLVGSAVMYGSGLSAIGNRFEGHVGPLAFGLLVHELRDSEIEYNHFVGNTVGLLVASAPDVSVSGNLFSDSGFGLVVQRVPRAETSAVRISGNVFRGNVADIAVDDPLAAVSVRGNSYENASRLDLDGDGVVDVAHVPSSSFDVHASRDPDLSLFALNPGVLLWQVAEASVPALSIASLADPEPRLDLAPTPLDGVAAAGLSTTTTDAHRIYDVSVAVAVCVTALLAIRALSASSRVGTAPRAEEAAG